MDTQLWMENAKRTIQSLSPRTEFEVKDLFQDVEWKTLSNGDRIKFGKDFKNEVTDGRISGVQYLGKKKNNHANYIRL